MNLSASERERLGRLADELIPADRDFPSASQAGVAHTGLDQVLAVRPELIEVVRKALQGASSRSPREALADLRCTDAAVFGALAELVAGAYFLNPQVAEKLGYAGQTPRVIHPAPDYLDDGLLESVIRRGPIFRPTPPDP